MNDTDFDSLSSLPTGQRWRGQLYPAPIVVALIRQTIHQANHPSGEEHYLLIHRNQSPYDGQWALVGGKWDFGEALKDAILREVKEETDLDAVFVAVRGMVSERVVTPLDDQQGAHFLILFCELLAGNGKAKEQDEGAIGWFTCQEIDALHESRAIIPSDYAMIRRFAGSKEMVPYIEAEMRAPIAGGRDEPILLQSFEDVAGHK